MCEKLSDVIELRTTIPPNNWGIPNSHSWKIERLFKPTSPVHSPGLNP